MEIINKIKLNYKSWLMVGIGVLVVIFILMPQSKQIPTGSTPSFNLANKEPQPSFIMNSPSEINWVTEDKQLGEEVGALGAVKPVLSDTRINSFLELMGLNKEEKTSEKNGIIFFNSSNGKKMVLADKMNNILEYSEDIVGKSDLQGEVKISSDEIKSKLYSLVGLILNDNQIQINIAESNFKKFIYPRQITAEEKDADMVEFRGGYNFEGKPINLYTGQPVSASYSMGGRLLKLIVQIPPQISSTDKKLTLMTLAQIKKIPMEKIKIWNVDGGADFELAGQQIIGKVNATDIILGYIYDQKGTLWPYYFITGNSFPDSGPVKVTLITSAVEE